MTEQEKNEILNTYKWIKVPKYIDDQSLSWEERYRKLDAHHIQETTFLIDKIRELVKLSNWNKFMHQPYDNRLRHPADFKVSYRFYSEQQGGRKSIPHQGATAQIFGMPTLSTTALISFLWFGRNLKMKTVSWFWMMRMLYLHQELHRCGLLILKMWGYRDTWVEYKSKGNGALVVPI